MAQCAKKLLNSGSDQIWSCFDTVITFKNTAQFQIFQFFLRIYCFRQDIDNFSYILSNPTDNIGKNWENSEDSEWARRLVTICRVVPTLILDLSLRSNGGYLTLQTTPWSNIALCVLICFVNFVRIKRNLPFSWHRYSIYPPIKLGLSYNTAPWSRVKCTILHILLFSRHIFSIYYSHQIRAISQHTWICFVMDIEGWTTVSTETLRKL